MTTAEIKLDLFRRIDNLSVPELEKFYSKFVELINSTSTYQLSDAERHAIGDALAEDNVQSSESVVNEARKRYPNLKFK